MFCKMNYWHKYAFFFILAVYDVPHYHCIMEANWLLQVFLLLWILIRLVAWVIEREGRSFLQLTNGWFCENACNKRTMSFCIMSLDFLLWGEFHGPHEAFVVVEHCAFDDREGYWLCEAKPSGTHGGLWNIHGIWMYHMIMKSKEIGALQINSATTLVQFETNVLKIRGLC